MRCARLVLPALVVLLAGSLLLASPARADGGGWPWDPCGCPPCAPARCCDPCPPVACAPVACEPPPCVPAVIPARCEWVSRTVECPPVTCQVRVPTYEDVEVPVYQTKLTPEYRDVEVPVYETRDVPVYAQRCVPRYQDVEVPVYACRQVPVTQEVCDPCTGQYVTMTCGWRTETYEDGTRTERRLAGHDMEQVQCGTRPERYLVGMRTEKVFAGHRQEVVQAGTRTERRLTGFTTEERVIRPASSRVVTERVVIPARRVTVAVGAPVDQVQPLPGTTEVLSRADFELARAEARAR